MDGGCRILIGDKHDKYSGRAVLLHPAHRMSPSVGLKNEKFLALCDPIEASQLEKCTDIFPSTPYLIYREKFVGTGKKFGRWRQYLHLCRCKSPILVLVR